MIYRAVIAIDWLIAKPLDMISFLLMPVTFCVLPGPVSDISVEQTDNKMLLKWNDIDDDNREYAVQAMSEGKPFGEPKLTSQRFMKFGLNELQPGKTYYFRVSVKSRGVQSVWVRSKQYTYSKKQ